MGSGKSTGKRAKKRVGPRTGGHRHLYQSFNGRKRGALESIQGLRVSYECPLNSFNGSKQAVGTSCVTLDSYRAFKVQDSSLQCLALVKASRG